MSTNRELGDADTNSLLPNLLSMKDDGIHREIESCLAPHRYVVDGMVAGGEIEYRVASDCK